MVLQVSDNDEDNFTMEQKNDIGWALGQMRNGMKVARAGWNGKGMWLALIPGECWSMHRAAFGPTVGGVLPSDTLPFVGMRTAQGQFVPWLCSQTDLLATDWELSE
jgi:hypothetical protein